MGKTCIQRVGEEKISKPNSRAVGGRMILQRFEF